MGFLQDWADRRKKAAEEARLQAEKDEREVRKAEREFKKAKKELWSALGTGLEEVLRNAGKELTVFQDQENKIKEIIRNPAILDTYPDSELDNLRITTQTELDTANKLGQDNHSLMTTNTNAVDAMANSLAESYLHQRRLLLSLVAANQQRRSRPQLPVTGAGRRKQLSTEIQDLITERNETMQNLSQRNASQDEIKQMENIYNDAIQKKQAELRKLLVP